MSGVALRDTWYLRKVAWCIHYLKGFTGSDQGSNILFLTKANWCLEKTKTGQAHGYMLLMYLTSPTHLQLSRLMNFQMNDFSMPSFSKHFNNHLMLWHCVLQFISLFQHFWGYQAIVNFWLFPTTCIIRIPCSLYPYLQAPTIPFLTCFPKSGEPWSTSSFSIQEMLCFFNYSQQS